MTPEEAKLLIDGVTVALAHQGIGKLPPRLKEIVGRFSRNLPEGEFMKGASPRGRELLYKQHEMFILHVCAGWHRGRDFICEFAEALEADGEPWPTWLKRFLIWGTRDGAKARREDGSDWRKVRKGQDPYGNVERDALIGMTVRFLVERRGYRAIRSPATAKKFPMKHSACSMVAAALNQLGVYMGERRVEAIWQETKKGTRNVMNRALERVLLGEQRHGNGDDEVDGLADQLRKGTKRAVH
jgi:hypothetical protein